MGHLNCPPRKKLLRIVAASIFVVTLGILYGHHLPNIPPTMKEHVSQYASALYLDHLSDHSQPQPVLEGEESPELPSEPIHLFTSVSSGRPAATATAPVHGCPAVPNAADFPCFYGNWCNRALRQVAAATSHNASLCAKL